MKNKKTMTRAIILFAFFALSNIGFSQITTEEDMAKAVFETIKSNDLETFTSYCATEDRFTKAVNGIGEDTSKEKGLKKELISEDANTFTNECINKFNLLHKELTDSDIAIKKGKLSKTITNETRVEVPNLKASDIKFEILFKNITYVISVNVFITEDDIFIFDFSGNPKIIRIKG